MSKGFAGLDPNIYYCLQKAGASNSNSKQESASLESTQEWFEVNSTAEGADNISCESLNLSKNIEK